MHRCSNCHGEFDIYGEYNKCPYCGFDTTKSILKGFLNPKTYLAAIIVILLVGSVLYVLLSATGVGSLYIRYLILILILLLEPIFKHLKKKLYKKTNGKIVDFGYSPGAEEGTSTFYAIIEYEYYDKTFRCTKKLPSLNSMDKNSLIYKDVEVYLNPETPTKSFAEFYKSDKNIIFKLYLKKDLLTIFFIIIVIMLISFLR